METLIAMAIALIMAAQQPNVPADLRVQALKTAQIALEYAQVAPKDVPVTANATVEPMSVPQAIETTNEAESYHAEI